MAADDFGSRASLAWAMPGPLEPPAVTVRRSSTSHSRSGLAAVRRMGASLLLLAAAASAAVADAPGDDAVYLPPQRPNRAAWRLYVYDVPWRALNISASAQARYQQMTTQDPPPAHDEGGLYHSVVSELPRLMPRWEPSAGELAAAAAGTGTAAVRGSSDKHFGEDVLFLLPLSPYHLCKAAEHPGTDWGTTWAAPKGSIPASIQQSTISAERDGLRTVGITCATYERAIDWLAVQPPYRLAPERHVFVHVLSHALRQAFRYDLRVHGGARSTYSRMGAGIVVTAEDRRCAFLVCRLALALVYKFLGKRALPGGSHWTWASRTTQIQGSNPLLRGWSELWRLASLFAAPVEA
ncbi:hypothetical protein T492DRAFT_1115861 [Pavlovales sp. CCMP2436]|nr:hypothetical protein T492DRAFT_1115861 [Pavlovales sp. CCMP2436]